MLFNEPKLLKFQRVAQHLAALRAEVSVLFNEPKLLKSLTGAKDGDDVTSFSALQRAEIAEIGHPSQPACPLAPVSVLFNEPKLLKSSEGYVFVNADYGFSALQRAEIAEI